MLSPTRPTVQPAHRVSAVVLRVAVVALASIAVSYGFSRLSGQIQDSVDVPVGVPALLAAALLTWSSPRRYGWALGTTAEHWRMILGCALVIVLVVTGFRATSGQVPYTPSFAEIVIVPLGEEGLFRGVLLVTIGRFLGRDLTAEPAAWTAVAISALAFGVGHLGNLGYVPTSFVIVQALAATAFGVVAGWVRIRTDSLAGPVMLHAAMNAAAVL